MRIVNVLKLDKAQLPYWSSMLMNGDNCVIEVVSKTFNPKIDQEWRDRYDECNHRMALEMLKEKDRIVLIKMLLQEEVKTNNKPKIY